MNPTLNPTLKKPLLTTITTILICLVCVVLSSCTPLRPGAINQSDQIAYDTLGAIQDFIVEARPRVEPCTYADGTINEHVVIVTINKHPECGTLSAYFDTVTDITEAYNEARTAYIGYREAVIDGANPTLTAVNVATAKALTLIFGSNELTTYYEDPRR